MKKKPVPPERYLRRCYRIIGMPGVEFRIDAVKDGGRTLGVMILAAGTTVVRSTRIPTRLFRACIKARTVADVTPNW